MRTDFSKEYLATDAGARANSILRSCVHCGFCNATCPTYQLTGDELDGPRGRIYLIRELLEGGDNQARATHHLDRCLTCRACETTCPSGVQYGELAEIARNHLGPARRGWTGRLRKALQWMIPNPVRLRRMARLGRFFRWVLPDYLADQVPKVVGAATQSTVGERCILLLNGCAQQVATATTNDHLARVLHTRGVGVRTLSNEQCCGALDLHLGDEATALRRIRANVDALYDQLGAVEAVISTASGCGVTVKDYARLLAGEADYAQRAATVAEKTMDVSEYLQQIAADLQPGKPPGTRIAWHAPCTLQHGQQLGGGVEDLLRGLGYELVPGRDSHLCCGAAGTYAILQPQLSEQLKHAKLQALHADQADFVATANVGCQMHMRRASPVPVMHWIELVK